MVSMSVIIITKNEEQNIGDCLGSVRWADEIIIVDAGSNDKTVEIAKKYTDKIFNKPWEGYGEAKNFGLSKCTGDWVFWIDADERVTAELQKEIKETVISKDLNAAALSVPRRAYFLGKWIKHCGWYPGRIVRIFRRSEGSFTQEKVHERIKIKGGIIELKADLLHYTDPDLIHYYDKFNNYTSLAAQELFTKNRFRIVNLIINPVWIFIKMYIIKLGFLDGVQGLILSVLSSHYVFTKYAKLWERSIKVEGEKR